MNQNRLELCAHVGPSRNRHFTLTWGFFERIRGALTGITSASSSLHSRLLAYLPCMGMLSLSCILCVVSRCFCNPPSPWTRRLLYSNNTPVAAIVASCCEFVSTLHSSIIIHSWTFARLLDEQDLLATSWTLVSLHRPSHARQITV